MFRRLSDLLTIVIPVKNEEKNLPACLENVLEFACESGLLTALLVLMVLMVLKNGAMISVGMAVFSLFCLSYANSVEGLGEI